MRTYSLNFWLLSLSTLLFMTGFNLIIPELNSYITSLGGAEYKGWIITLFTITAAISRPFSGKLADTVGRKSVILFGGLVSAVICFLYPFFISVFGFLMLRFLHGFSTGFQPTGATSFVADIVPPNKRGEAMGIFGMTISIGMGVGQSLGSWVAMQVGINGLFMVAGILSFLSIAILPTVKETLESPVKFKFSLLKIPVDEIIETRVWLPGIIMFLTTICSGIIFVLYPDISENLDIENKGIFMGVYLLATLGVRVIAGKASDRFGRRMVLITGMILLIFAMLLVGNATTTFWYFVGAVFFGLATGFNSPTVFAWTTDLAQPKFKGRALATLFITLEVGIGFGAYLTGWLYNNNPENFFRSLFFASFCALIALFILLLPFSKKHFPKFQ